MQDQLITLAKKIRKIMWNWHIYLGNILTGLFGIRFIFPLFGEITFQGPFTKELLLKEKLQNFVYLVFYVCVALSLAIGLLMKFEPSAIKNLTEAIHVLSIIYLATSIVRHNKWRVLAGVY